MRLDETTAPSVHRVDDHDRRTNGEQADRDREVDPDEGEECADDGVRYGEELASQHRQQHPASVDDGPLQTGDEYAQAEIVLLDLIPSIDGPFDRAEGSS